MSKFSIHGDSNRKLRKLVKQAKKAAGSNRDMGPAMRRIAVFLDKWVLQNFKTEGGKVGGWPPFKYGGRVQNQRVLREKAAVAGFRAAGRAKSAEAKAAAYNRASSGVFDRFSLGSGGGAIVDATAKMLQDTGTLRRSFNAESNKTNAWIGSDLPYAKPHNEGLKVPKRRMLPKEAEIVDPVSDILDAFVERQILDPMEQALR